MKRVAPVFLIFLMLLFAGCKVKTYTPEIPYTFNQNVKVISGDFSYDCRICKTEKDVAVTVDSTSAKGMIMTYDGNKLAFSFADYSYEIDGRNFEKRNPAIVIYEVFEYLNSVQQLDAKKIDNGFKYEGKISLGDFILIQNEDNSIKSIAIRNTEYRIDFVR